MIGNAVRRAWVALLLAPLTAHSRPVYFDNLTSMYGIVMGEDLYACGICHRRWEGTGGRNPFGLAVEQQLYLGKSITEAITDIAGEDTDGDGYTNDDELANFRTLPGYSCANFDLVIDPPANFQSLITPGVPTCLEPKDIKVDPTDVSFVTRAGSTANATVTILNNGADFALQVTGVALLPGAPASLTVTAPTLPVSIPVGGSVPVTLTFAPTGSLLVGATLRITSDDPDETDLDVPVSLLAFVQPLAPSEVRGACLKDVEKQLEQLTKARLGACGRCYLDELRGVACDAARRDLTVAKAEARLRDTVGGARDRHCAANTLSPSLLGMSPQCGAPCEAINLTSIARLADCAACRATAATDAMLAATVGTTPPDLPGNLLGPDAWRCNRHLVRGVQKGIRSVQKSLGTCELSAALAGTPADCASDLAGELAENAAQVDARRDRCVDTTNMLGCLFEMNPDPTCLGTATTQIGTDLVETVFAPD